MMKIAIGNDHRGYALKKKIVKWLGEHGHDVNDFGAHSEESADYPDFAHAVAGAIANGEVDRGILICGTGIGMCMTANKLKGIRAALCYKSEYAVLARQHNDANILCLGELNGDEHNLEVLRAFINTAFEGGRHQCRVDKIADCY